MSTTVHIPESGLDQQFNSLSIALEIARDSAPSGVVAFLKSPSGVDIPLPESVFDLLINVVDVMKSGSGVCVIPMKARLTTQEAADFLGVSRPTFIKLASAYEAKLDLVGRHRRIALEDLQALQMKIRVKREAALQELIEINKSAGFYSHEQEVLPRKE